MFNYNPWNADGGRLLTRALGNGLTQTYDYYPWNQQGGRLHTLVAGNLQNLSYAYDSVGNIISIADSINSQTQSFDYDALDRLTSASANGEPGQGAYDETYQYDPATGNLKVKGDMTLDYLDSNHVHAVTNANGNTYSYDDNGNQTTRHIGNDTFHLIYDAENRLVEVKENNVTIAEFTFDGDGKRVMSVIDGETIRFVGGYYERKGSEITKYYMAGAARVAIRKYTIPQSMTVEYMLGDHLGSTSITTDSNGAKVSEMRYKPWGELRYTWTDAPANTSPAYELTRYQYTGQYSYDAEFGLKYYGARFYDVSTGRFTQPDTIIPQSQGTQAYDRYAYTNNNPVRYNDPTGHCVDGITTLLCAAAFGALIGGAVNAYFQYRDTGSINLNEVAGAAVAGAVSAVVLTALAPASLAGAFLAGGAANVIGNQAGALVEGALNTDGGESYWDNYAEAGGVYDGESVTNLDGVAVDFVVGGVVNAGVSSIQHGISKIYPISDPFAKPQGNYNPVEFRYQGNGQWMGYKEPLLRSSVQTGGRAAIMNQASDYFFEVVSEYSEQWLEDCYDDGLACSY